MKFMDQEARAYVEDAIGNGFGHSYPDLLDAGIELVGDQTDVQWNEYTDGTVTLTAVYTFKKAG
jgi:hypothetical protein